VTGPRRDGAPVDAATAALAAQVAPSTLRKWVQRGLITPVAHGARGKNLYDLGEVVRAANRPQSGRTPGAPDDAGDLLSH
jgi:predicted site-specific integrase-resolvase